MNLVRFCDNRFQELKMKGDAALEYDAVCDSQIKAVHAILNWYRVWMKWLFIPKMFWEFALVKMHLREEPVPVLMNKIKADQQAKKVTDTMIAEGKIKSIKTELNETTQGKSQTPAS